jgi:peptidoglycan/LPS O-acetylase OafA/YrhL
MIVHLWGSDQPSPAVVAQIAFPITYLLALTSWHGVEKRALAMKHTLAGRRAARATARRAAPTRRRARPALKAAVGLTR